MVRSLRHTSTRDIYADIRDRMRSVAGDLNITEIAERTGCHKESVRRYLRGDRPGVEFLIGFSRAFNVSLDWLVFGLAPVSHAQRALHADAGRGVRENSFDNPPRVVVRAQPLRLSR